jgi:hypothetical protein
MQHKQSLKHSLSIEAPHLHHGRMNRGHRTGQCDQQHAQKPTFLVPRQSRRRSRDVINPDPSCSRTGGNGNGNGNFLGPSAAKNSVGHSQGSARATQNSNNKSLLSRGRQWFRRKSENAQRAGHAVSESCLVLPIHAARLPCSEMSLLVMSSSESCESQLLVHENSGSSTGSSSTLELCALISFSSRGASTPAGVHAFHALHTKRSACAVAEGTTGNGADVSGCLEEGRMGVPGAPRESPWRIASRAFVTHASADLSHATASKSFGGGGTTSTRNNTSSRATPSFRLPQLAPHSASTPDSSMHAANALLAGTSPPHIGQESASTESWRAFSSTHGTQSSIQACSEQSYAPHHRDQHSNVAANAAPFMDVHCPSDTPGPSILRPSGVTSAAQSTRDPGVPSGSSAGSHSHVATSGASGTGEPRSSSGNQGDAPSKLLSMGFASSNMSGTEWSLSSPSLAGDILLPGSRLGSEAREADHSVDCSPVVAPCMSTTGELPVATSEILGESNTDGLLDGLVRMPVVPSTKPESASACGPASLLSRTPSVAASDARPGPAMHAHSSPASFAESSSCTSPRLTSSTPIIPHVPGGVVLAHDTWAVTTPRKRIMLGDRPPRTPANVTSALTASTEPSLPEELSANVVHSQSSHTLSQSLASPLKQSNSNGTVSMSLSIAPMSTMASTALSGDFSSSVRGSPQKPPRAPHLRAQYAGAVRMHTAHHVRRGGSMHAHLPMPHLPHGQPLQAASLTGQGTPLMRGATRRISVRRRGHRIGGTATTQNQGMQEDLSGLSCDGSSQSCMHRLESSKGDCTGTVSTCIAPNQADGTQNSSPSPMGSRRATDESGCCTTPNSSATLGHMHGFKGVMGTLSALDSSEGGRGGESDTCTGVLCCF